MEEINTNRQIRIQNFQPGKIFLHYQRIKKSLTPWLHAEISTATTECELHFSNMKGHGFESCDEYVEFHLPQHSEEYISRLQQ